MFLVELYVLLEQSKHPSPVASGWGSERVAPQSRVRQTRKNPRMRAFMWVFVWRGEVLHQLHLHKVEALAFVGIQNELCVECRELNNRLAHAKEHPGRKSYAGLQTCGTEACSVF